MGYSDIKKALMTTQLTQVQAALTSAYTALTEGAASGVESYAFDSGEGSQRTTRRSLKEMQDIIDVLEAKQDHLINELYNMGLIAVALRRKTPC
jgi:6-phosphogluconolactonase (cycloisomerase 2 family)